jgi:hypothetical protein
MLLLLLAFSARDPAACYHRELLLLVGCCLLQVCDSAAAT